MDEEKKTDSFDQGRGGPTPDWENDDHPQMPTKVRDLFVWTSASHQKRDYPKGFFTTLIAICLLLSIILVFIQEYVAILVVWCGLFLFYALSKLQPEPVEHKITTQGILTLKTSYLWGDLGAFWFTERNGETFLHVAARNIFGQVAMMIDEKDKETIRDILAHYLPFIEVWEKSTTEKIADWISKKFPIYSTSYQAISSKPLDDKQMEHAGFDEVAGKYPEKTVEQPPAVSPVEEKPLPMQQPVTPPPVTEVKTENPLTSPAS